MAQPIQLNDFQQRSDLSLGQYDLYKKKEYCDVTLCITDPRSCDQIYSIECHKLVLAAASSYVRDVLNAGDDSSDVNMIDLGKGTVDVIKQVISFIYCGKCEVSSKNIVELYRYSLQWKLSNLERLLSEIFSECLEVNNIVAALELVFQEGKAALEKKASRYFREHLSALLNTETFKQVSVICLCLILKEDEINVDSEDTIVKAVLEWLKQRTLSNVEAEELWKLIRFEHLSSSYLLHELLDHPLMQQDPQRRMVKEAIHNLHVNKVTRSSLPRYWGVKPVYDKLAKITNDYKICVYNDKHLWEQVGNAPEWIDKLTHSCVTDSMLLLLGTGKNEYLGNWVMVDLKRGMLMSQVHTITGEKKDVMGAAQINNTLYSIGGRIDKDNKSPSSEVKSLNLEQCTKTWDKIEPLIEAVRNPLVFTYKHKIFVIGGINKKNYGVKTNQMYDTKQHKWTLRSEVPIGCYSYQHGGFLRHNQIYIFTGQYRMVYTIDTDSWTYVEYDKVGHHIQPVLHGNQILACVRATSIVKDEPSEFVCKRYEEDTNQWSDTDIDVKDCMMHHMFFTYRK